MIDRGYFRFKKFNCRHLSSSMKVGVDAVLLASWADIRQCRKVLDVGTGCGVIALICAQRCPDVHVDAIDVHIPSVGEAQLNFNNSPWGGRLDAFVADFNSFSGSGYDLIISNPPFFNSGIINPSGERMIARHQDSLSPTSLLSGGKRLLNPGGSIAMIFPADQLDTVVDEAGGHGFFLGRYMKIRGNPNAKVKRVLTQFYAGEDAELIDEGETQILEIMDNEGNYTPGYVALGKDLYLKF
ncbi:MAG: methyltransferase [Candidatus Amulumruptor caecigallinarius]|nr:methyltransferase [Candidatus Amulumruptor caecigallinarius]